jgi:hypothetical protein
LSEEVEERRFWDREKIAYLFVQRALAANRDIS